MVHSPDGGGWVRWLGAAGAALVAASLIAGLGPHTIRTGPDSLRLRVIASSNTPSDQRLKAEVRYAVLATLGPGIAHASSAVSATRYVQQRLSQIAQVSRSVVRHADSDEAVQVSLGPAPFPAKALGALRFPPGTYPALVVTLGAGQGHNWWTVLFPPLAFLTSGNNLVVVGASSDSGGTLTAAERQTLLQWVAGHADAQLNGSVVTVQDGGATTVVEVRFLLWQLLRTWLH